MISNITDLLTAVSSWIISTVTSTLEIFYDSAAGEFTVLGVLALIGAGVGLIMLVIRVIRGFFVKA